MTADSGADDGCEPESDVIDLTRARFDDGSAEAKEGGRTFATEKGLAGLSRTW